MNKTKKGLLSLIFALILISTGIIAAFAADGGGGAGDDAGPGSGGVGSTTGDLEYVWYDRGGWADSTSSGSKVAPKQGAYSLDKGWIKNPDGKSTVDFFFSQLNKKISAKYPDYAGYHDSWGERNAQINGSAKAFVEPIMEKACKNAINRSGDKTQTARVVGIAVTYGRISSPNGLKKGWGIANYRGSHSYSKMFGKPTDEELPKKYGWATTVDKTKRNNAKTDEIWRDYIYRIGEIDNPDSNYSQATITSQGVRIIVVAVTDSEPEIGGKLKLKKTSSNTSISG